MTEIGFILSLHIVTLYDAEGAARITEAANSGALPLLVSIQQYTY